MDSTPMSKNRFNPALDWPAHFLGTVMVWKPEGGTELIKGIQMPIKHGLEGTPTYRSWRAMKTRCLNSNQKCFKNHGARGISICEKWMDFAGFVSDMGIRPEGTTLERKDNSLGYCKDNCKWATRTEQNRNKRTNVWFTIDGVTRCVAEWASIHGINKDTLGSRIKSGWDLEDLFTPSRPMKPRKTINQ